MDLPESRLSVAWQRASASLAAALVVASASASALVASGSAWALGFATSSPTQSRPLASAAGKIQGPSSSLWPTGGGCGSKGLVQALAAPPWLKLRGWQWIWRWNSYDFTIPPREHSRTHCAIKTMADRLSECHKCMPEHIQTRCSNHTHVAQKSSKQAVSTSTAKAHLVGAFNPPLIQSKLF